MYLLCFSLLLLTLHLHCSTAHPLSDPDTDRELDSFKGILERLEDKLALIEALETSPGTLESRADDLAQQVTPAENGDPETRAARNNPLPINDSLLKGLRALQNRKMTRPSGCFGRKIDRIDSLSGLGCNGFRRNLLSVDTRNPSTT
ncbi:natriuretic peptides A-like [Mixophyes fleayi]|uniref:natriuretic peptides A-like n=1 Tax=Mixophyes fleayi TaxID=3061075 RepID=UPI003F4DE97F